MTSIALLCVCGFSVRTEPQLPVAFQLDPSSGIYSVRDGGLGWSFQGQLGGKVEHLMHRSGRDILGRYDATELHAVLPRPVAVTVLCYRDEPVVRFRIRYLTSGADSVVFPNWTSTPSDLKQFGYRDSAFAPPTFGPPKTSSPWLLFNAAGSACVFAPTSEFMLAKMVGNGRTQMGAGLDERLKSIPAGFEQDSVMVFSTGIDAAWDAWGKLEQQLAHKIVPPNDRDVVLKKFGYWTDNGADYYYNYDPKLGYAGTLSALVDRYRREQIPLGYLQLDSWWYQKSTNDPAGRPAGAKKNRLLPIGSWNRYGGTMEYRASPDLFPRGLSEFQSKVGLPLVVHSRWIDRKSPYHDRYKISGVGAVDPTWWNDTAKYLRDSGVTCYEQDWLDEIFINSPEMARSPGVAEAFTNGMANACSANGLTVQYCMGTPRFFLQALRYPNLTTIRTSGDRFEPGKWSDFLYVSQLAKSVGVWPWCDVFKSRETGNMILSTLSAGPVGTGDALGRENRANILSAARLDGVIVKPDQAIVPCDQTYQDGAVGAKAPFVASTYTSWGDLRVTYLFAFPRIGTQRHVQVRLAELGIASPIYAYNMVKRSGRVIDNTGELEDTIGPEGYSYWVLTPVTKCGIALLGDLGKFVPSGKARVDGVSASDRQLRLTVKFARQERQVSISGYAPTEPSVASRGGTATLVGYDANTHLFSYQVHPTRPGQTVALTLEPAR